MTVSQASAYPLEWPDSWPRTPDAERKTTSPFNTTFDRARRMMADELRRLGADSVVISSWLAVRTDGNPYADQARRRIPDPGVAVYFMLRGKQMVMARDAYATVHDNLRSIGLAIEHLRGLERHGGGTMTERAFAGFTALPSPERFDPWAVMGLKPDATDEAINAQFKTLVKRHHPDLGGDNDGEAIARITRARDMIYEIRGRK